ncbi:MAG: methyltransferase domain-containing protein [Ruminococcaceae bacterium]|nr:methyltransferase domain-containing protein [Oscillospiraceae bacterium]
MKIADYRKYISADTLMGPNSLQLLAELLNTHPITLSADDTVLDLGCGKGLSSFAIARETGAHVTATDLWIPAADNALRFESWGVGGQITAAHADANDLPFDAQQFAAMISIDAYHYFAGEPGFFPTKLLPLLRDGAAVLIGIPGIRDAYSGRSEELLSDWLGDEAYMFKSSSQWKEIIGAHPRIACVETFEMSCFDDAWDDWFATGHKYALGDREHYDALIRPYTCFVGIYVKLK